MIASGMPVHPDDLPPALEWEQPVWDLYELVQTQMRIGFSGAAALDYNPAIAVMQQKGWDLELGLSLLRTIELEVMKV